MGKEVTAGVKVAISCSCQPARWYGCVGLVLSGPDIFLEVEVLVDAIGPHKSQLRSFSIFDLTPIEAAQ